MTPIRLDVSTYNQLPAICRKTIDGERFALVNGEWRPVELVRSLPKPPVAVCLSIPAPK